jgi:hypothetical protein
MASKKDKEKIDVLYVESSSSMISYVPPIHLPPIYIPLLTVRYLFSIEKNHSHNKSPKELALSYFPPQKNLDYYTNILFQTGSIRFHPIYSKTSDSLNVRAILHILSNLFMKKIGECILLL